MPSRSSSPMTAPRPSIFSSCAVHSSLDMCCSVMRAVLWQEVQAALTLACIGPGGSGLPGALGACAFTKNANAIRNKARENRCNKRSSPHGHRRSGRSESPSRAPINFISTRSSNRTSTARPLHQRWSSIWIDSMMVSPTICMLFGLNLSIVSCGLCQKTLLYP